MQITILLMFIISHIFFDFIFQNEDVIEQRFSIRKSDRIKGNKAHAKNHFIGMLVALILYIILFGGIYANYIGILCGIAIITVSHYFIDSLKSELSSKIVSYKNNVWVFISDQLIHIFIIIITILPYRVIGLLILLIDGQPLKEILKICTLNFEFIDKWLIAIAIFLSCTFAAGIFIKIFFEHKNYKDDKKNKNRILKQNLNLGTKSGGMIIGILERSIIIISIISGYHQFVAFILTTKSIARFKKLDNEVFAEFFIIGTLISFIIAIIGGILIRLIDIFPSIC